MYYIYVGLFHKLVFVCVSVVYNLMSMLQEVSLNYYMYVHESILQLLQPYLCTSDNHKQLVSIRTKLVQANIQPVTYSL